jgi:SAM-dependent methyltransferase
MPREWDAVAYDRLGSPMTKWGETVVGWLELDGDERVLDAGCGTGRVTEWLLERLPRGRVIALDGSTAMVDRAQTRLAPYVDRIDYVVADLEPDDLEPSLVTMCLGDHVETMDDDERRRFVRAVADRMPGPRIDYVRLNIRARRAG